MKYCGTVLLDFIGKKNSTVATPSGMVKVATNSILKKEGKNLNRINTLVKSDI